MLNLLYSGQLKAMPVRLRSQDDRNTDSTARLLLEEEVAAYVEEIQPPSSPATSAALRTTLSGRR